MIIYFAAGGKQRPSSLAPAVPMLHPIFSLFLVYSLSLCVSPRVPLVLQSASPLCAVSAPRVSHYLGLGDCPGFFNILRDASTILQTFFSRTRAGAIGWKRIREIDGTENWWRHFPILSRSSSFCVTTIRRRRKRRQKNQNQFKMFPAALNRI